MKTLSYFTEHFAKENKQYYSQETIFDILQEVVVLEEVEKGNISRYIDKYRLILREYREMPRQMTFRALSPEFKKKIMFSMPIKDHHFRKIEFVLSNGLLTHIFFQRVLPKHADLPKEEKNYPHYVQDSKQVSLTYQELETAHMKARRAYNEALNELGKSHCTLIVPAEHEEYLARVCRETAQREIDNIQAQKFEAIMKERKFAKDRLLLLSKLKSIYRSKDDIEASRRTKYVYGRTPNDKLGRSGVGKEDKQIPPYGR